MRTARPYRTTATGFTLIELVVVIGIIAIFMLYGMPQYKSVTTQNRMAGEINDLANDVEVARSTAISSGLSVVICPSAAPTAATPSCSGSNNWATGWIVFTDAGNNQTFNTTGDTLVHIHTALSTDTLTGSASDAVAGPYTGDVALLEFNRMGGASNGTGTNGTPYTALSLHDSSNTSTWQRCVIVSGVGTSTIASNASPGTLNSTTLTGANCP
ncbi:MAG TPA: GspH/FimT family pseudopilin [Dyella sp.]|uniref:GspH/FimT family pseudopilin n=1 Tax=Dyella sp. TaxID=1869338 RepID=UPI002CA941CA|nr:GspH/FimT family pseudopilin [Dyella sp.]HTV85706.1 GspH/FimT family pseudopilin [Dyella sp.]